MQEESRPSQTVPTVTPVPPTLQQLVGKKTLFHGEILAGHSMTEGFPSALAEGGKVRKRDQSHVVHPLNYKTCLCLLTAGRGN